MKLDDIILQFEADAKREFGFPLLWGEVKVDFNPSRSKTSISLQVLVYPHSKVRRVTSREIRFWCSGWFSAKEFGLTEIDIRVRDNPDLVG